MRKGFTIIELLVAMTLFVVVVSIVSGVFINSIRNQQALVSLIAANDNASLVLEQMAREIRTGFNFSVTNNHSELHFNSKQSGSVVYKINNETKIIERNNQALTSGNTKVNYLLFDLLGERIGDGLATRVTVRLGISARYSKIEDIVVALQTTVSSRQFDN